MFWAIDGLDGSGKSTAAEGLAGYLQSEGREVVLIEHPSTGIAGSLCRRLLLKEGTSAKMFSAVFLFMDMIGTGICMRRHRGKDVIVVRYALSACYLPRPFSFVLYRVVSAVLPRPDASILMDVDPEVALGRVSSRGGELEMFENLTSMEHVRSRMLSVSDDLIVIDANRDIREVLEDIMVTLNMF